MISTHLYLYKHVLNDMGFIFQNKTKKTYIFVKLFEQDVSKDNIV
jgi:hypothetical protein